MLQRIEVSIEKDTKEGSGQGLYQTSKGAMHALEIPFTITGDKVETEILRKHGHTHQGRLKRIISPSADRATPPCIHYQICGGCSLQHVSYARTLALKAAYVKECFSELSLDETTIHPIQPSPVLWRYRNKMDYAFSQDKQKTKFLGLRMHHEKRKVLALAECYLANEWFSDALKAIQQWWKASDLEAYHPVSNRGALRMVTMREGVRSGDRLVMLTVSGNPSEALTKQHLDAFVDVVKNAAQPKAPQSCLSIFLRLQHVAKGVPTTFGEMWLYGPEAIREVFYIQPFIDAPLQALTFHINPTTFFQPNTLVAEQLYSRLLQMAEITPEMVVYDFFSGPGTLGICIAPYAKKVVSVEISPETALNARTNIRINEIENHTVITSAVRHVLHANVPSSLLDAPDVITISPPRAGLDSQALQTLLNLNSQKILYTSCNPHSQVQNLKPLIAAGYRLRSIQPVDQFPQTSHVTNIALLVR